MNRRHTTPWLRALAVVSVGAMSLAAGPLSADQPMWWGGRMELTSTSFRNGHPLPAANIYNAPDATGFNVCSPSGAMGGDESPQLTWRDAPPNTRSFVVVLYDTTASFTHWGMYNIAPYTRMLPEDAGIANSPYGLQVINDFMDQHYDGPCPPAGYAPEVHHYVFTVYALDTTFVLGSANFPANGGALYQALLRASLEGHVLASASLVALNRGGTPPAN